MHQTFLKTAILTSAILVIAGCVDDNSAGSEGENIDAQASGADTAAMGGQGGAGGAMAEADVNLTPPGGDGAVVEPDMSIDLDMEAPEPDAAVPQRPFSFFVTSLEAMRRLSGSQDGFGGNFGGLEGADNICQTIAEGVGVGGKTWRAFLSVVRGPDGQPVHAIERIGGGPWYDANERLVAENIEGLLNERPDGDQQTINDLPDEYGVPITALGDAHDVVTASNKQGRLNSMDPGSTCNDWTSDSGEVGNDLIMCGHSFPRMARGGGRPGGGRPGGGRPGGGGRGGGHWLSDHSLRGCAPGVEVRQTGGGQGLDFIGASGGYGGLYCFALSP